MAGEIEEEPFRLNFKLEALHSGSISFGRFENEALSWERRSSFSRNRYLEEVEKYSKPGSVTEKKAIFEAHFKKRALLSQSSSEWQYEAECQTSKNNVTKNKGYEGDFEIVNEGSQSACFGATESTGYDRDFEHFNGGRYSVNFDDSACGSLNDREHKLTEREKEDSGIWYSEPRNEPASDIANTVTIISEYFEREATCCPIAGIVVHEHETQTKEVPVGEGGSTDGIVAHEHETQTKEVPVAEGGSTDVASNIAETSNAHTVHKDVNIRSVPQQSPFPKVRSSSQTKHLKPRSVSQVNAVKANSIISRESFNSKDILRKPTRREIDVSQRPKREKLTLESATASTSISRTLKHEVSKFESAAVYTSRSMSGTPKNEPSYGSRGKVLNDWKSSSIEKESRTREKVSPTVHQNANRHKQALSSTKTGVKQNRSGFSFKCEERAERRKEFLMKLEEKMNAKEAKMHQIQTSKQKKVEVEVRQLRRSLDFKRTPMPSFYHEARPWSDKFKTFASKSTPSKPQHKCTSPRTVAAGNSVSCSGAAFNHSISTSELPLTASSPQTSVTTKHNSTLSSDGSMSSALPTASNAHPAHAGADRQRTRKNNQEQKQLMSSLKQRPSGVNKVNKSHKVEVKPKAGAGRTESIDLRNDIKGIHLGSSSQINRVAVGVAS